MTLAEQIRAAARHLRAEHRRCPVDIGGCPWPAFTQDDAAELAATIEAAASTVTVTEYGVLWPNGDDEAQPTRERAAWVSQIHGHGNRLVVSRTVTYGPWQPVEGES